MNNEINIEKKIFSQYSVNCLFIYDFHFDNEIFYILSGYSGFEKDEVVFMYNLDTGLITELYIFDEIGNMQTPRMQLLDSGNILLSYSIRVENENILFLREIDQEGNTIWKYTNENKRESFVNSFIQMSDSTYILGGVKTKDDPDSNDDKVIPYLLKFNYNQRKITARSDFGIPSDEWFWLNGTVEEIVPSHDGRAFLCVSKLYEFPIDPNIFQCNGMIAKVDHDLNVIWKRQYAYIAGEYNYHLFEDIIATTDGNYLAYGTSGKTFSYPGEVPFLSWAIKIDEDGKIVGDTTTATVEWEDIDLSDQIEIFPNPASDYIYINQNNIEDITYKVFDLSGRLIESFTLSDHNQSVVKSVDTWSKGYHIVQMEKDGRLIGSSKILKF